MPVTDIHHVLDLLQLISHRRAADESFGTQEGLALVLLDHGFDGARLAPDCITGTAFGEASPVSVRFHFAACSAGTRHLLHEHCLGEKLVPAIG